MTETTNAPTYQLVRQYKDSGFNYAELCRKTAQDCFKSVVSSAGSAGYAIVLVAILVDCFRTHNIDPLDIFGLTDIYDIHQAIRPANINASVGVCTSTLPFVLSKFLATKGGNGNL